MPVARNELQRADGYLLLLPGISPTRRPHDEHKDGWGIAFFEGRGCRLFLDSKPAAYSPVAELVRDYPIHSLNVIAHIRKAARGSVAVVNRASSSSAYSKIST